MWVNSDDQGRLTGDPEEIKYATCPNIDHITKTDIPQLLEELDKNLLIKVYNTSITEAVQMLDWWEVQKLQWAYPSAYPPPEGWQDRLRYHASPTQIVTGNWPPSSQPASELLPSKLPSTPPKELPSKVPKERQGSEKREIRNKTGREKEEEEGRLPSALGSKPSPTPSTTTAEKDILGLVSKLKGWKPHEDDDLTWLRGFKRDFPTFGFAELKACVDYHSGRSPPEHKGGWKNRFRNWMIKKQEFDRQGGSASGRDRETGKHSGSGRNYSQDQIKHSIGQPIQEDTDAIKRSIGKPID